MHGLGTMKTHICTKGRILYLLDLSMFHQISENFDLILSFRILATLVADVKNDLVDDNN